MPLAMIVDNRFHNVDIEKQVFNGSGVELVLENCTTSEEVGERCTEADALLLNMTRIDRPALLKLKRCKVISRYGIGIDNIDAVTAREMGITITNVPGYCSHEVAEHALGLIFSIARNIPLRDRALREGKWNLRIHNERIAGSVLGVLGFGDTAKMLIKTSMSIGFKEILAWSPSLTQSILDSWLSGIGATSAAVHSCTMEDILRRSDWLSLHIPLNASTRELIGQQQFALMKPGACIINTSRGAILDEKALCAALRTNTIAGAGLDVFVDEPLPEDSELRAFPHVVLTDHSAFASRKAIEFLRQATAQNALRVLREQGIA